MKKKIALITLAIITIIALGLSAFYCSNSYKLNYASSSQYSNADIDKAAKAVSAKLDSFDGHCKLVSLTYAGDDTSNDNLDYVNSLNEARQLVDGTFDQCLVFRSNFISPLISVGAWQGHSVYKWDWYLARQNNGSWIVVEWGYC